MEAGLFIKHIMIEMERLKAAKSITQMTDINTSKSKDES